MFFSLLVVLLSKTDKWHVQMLDLLFLNFSPWYDNVFESSQWHYSNNWSHLKTGRRKYEVIIRLFLIKHALLDLHFYIINFNIHELGQCCNCFVRNRYLIYPVLQDQLIQQVFYTIAPENLLNWFASSYFLKITFHQSHENIGYLIPESKKPINNLLLIHV